MNAREIIAIVAGEQRYSINALAEKIGVTRANLNNIMRGSTKNVSANVANHIVATFPEYSLEWLLTGEGEPHVTSETNTVKAAVTAPNFQNTGDNVHNEQNGGDLVKALLKSQEQIDRLLSIIETMQGK